MQLTAGKAFLRPAQNRSRSASLVETFVVVAPSARGDLLDDADEQIHLRRRSVEFDDHQRRRVGWIAAGLETLHRVDRGLVHHLEAAGNNAARNNRADATRAGLDAGKSEQKPARRRGLAQDAHGDFGDDAEQPFRAGHQTHEVV